MTKSSTKTRFCPSPTGMMHTGNLRTALFNYLIAMSKPDGSFLLRIEDTDRERSKPEYTEALKADLLQLGLKWQEGPDVGGENGPYHQTERMAQYEAYFERLIAENKAFWCFCTEKELAITRKAQLSSGQAPRYPGTCRHLSSEEVATKRAQGLEPALRFRVPDDQMIVFEDGVQGTKQFSSNDLGDFVIRKQDGTPTFMFANAVDDALMGVKWVVRGEDHLTNTPRQLMILEALGLEKPFYAHMPLIVGSDHKPLSKRNGSQTVTQLFDAGYLPLGLMNYLARLGHHYVDEPGFMDLETLASNFSLAHVGRAPAHFDRVQLDHWQKEAVLALDNDEFWSWVAGTVHTWVSQEAAKEWCAVVQPNVVFPADAELWAKVVYSMDWAYSDASQGWLKELSGDVIESLLTVMSQQPVTFDELVSLFKANGLKGKKLFMPLRAILTGLDFGPELPKLYKLMSHEMILARVERAHRFLNNI